MRTNLAQLGLTWFVQNAKLHFTADLGATTRFLERGVTDQLGRPKTAVVDADVHNEVPTIRALMPYLSDYWQETVNTTAFDGADVRAFPPGLPTSTRTGAMPPNGVPGSDIDLLTRQALGPDVEVAILNCTYAVDAIHNPYAAAAVAAAINDWQIAEWLEREPRLRASIVVPSQNPELAAAEIARVGEYPGFVQVAVPARTAMPIGRLEFHPLFAAAVEHNLVVGVHAGGFSGYPTTAVGWPTYCIEDYAGMSTVMQAQVMSMLVEGLFVEFPELRVAMLDTGCTWLPSFMSRLDKDWKGLRRETPWVLKQPSDYLREHIRFTTNPLDIPTKNMALTRALFDQMGGSEMLMHGSDYPHWEFRAQHDAFMSILTDDEYVDVMGGTARAFYQLAPQAA
jgi:uncharacterized protein